MHVFSSVIALLLSNTLLDAFTISSTLRHKTHRSFAASSSRESTGTFGDGKEMETYRGSITESHEFLENGKKMVGSAALAIVLAFSTVTATPAHAYEDSDYASEAVTEAVQALKAGRGDVAKSFAAFENIAEIITEGKGVGGSVSGSGVNLERGYIADEDTTIYNPGLTLLTESEKERLVDAVIQTRKVGLERNAWSENNEYAYDFLKQMLDPLHMYELKGYLSILPFYGAAVYLAALFVQQNARNLFPAAYIGGALLVFGPIFALIAFGS